MYYRMNEHKDASMREFAREVVVMRREVLTRMRSKEHQIRLKK